MVEGESEELVTARFNYCLYANVEKGKGEARKICMTEVLNELMGTEIIAHRWYGELKILLPVFVDEITEIENDEADHLQKLKTIFGHVQRNMAV